MNYKIKKLLKAIFHIFITKKMLLGIIFALLIILLGNKVFASTETLPLDTPTSTITVIGNIPTLSTYNQSYTITYPTAWASYYKNFIYTTGGLVLSPSSTGYVYLQGGYTKSLYWSDCASIYSNSTNWVLDTNYVSGVHPVLATIGYSTIDIYNNANKDTLYFDYVEPVVIEPYIVNTVTDLTGLLSTDITVDTGNVSVVNDTIRFQVAMGVVGSQSISVVYETTLSNSSPFYNTGGVNGDYYEIPVSIFKNSLIEGYQIHYILRYQIEEDMTSDITVIYTPNISEMTDAEQIQNVIQQNSAIISNALRQNSQIQQQTQDFLTDDNFNSGNLNLPTDNSQDITQDGINNIFTMIYNAFTSGTAPDIVIPIPFTNKSFTIQANYLRNILNNSQFAFVSNIIELFWWYIISVFIIKDIANKMNKIKSGDVENLQDTNIKEDML